MIIKYKFNLQYMNINHISTHLGTVTLEDSRKLQSIHLLAAKHPDRQDNLQGGSALRLRP